MNTVEFDRLLAESLADQTLQTAEKKSLIDWSTSHADDDGKRAVARSRAFLAARNAIASEPERVLNWLEDVIKILARPLESSADSRHREHSHAYFSPGNACIQEVLRQFNQARQTCDVCVFTITDNRISDALIRAHARRVRVRVLTDDQKSHDLGSDIDRLRSAGIECKMDVGQVAHMHHKFALFDGRRLMNGSFNWTRSASEQNEENLIVTSDPALVATFSDRFEQLWQRLEG